jgi:hypothetical protein
MADATPPSAAAPEAATPGGIADATVAEARGWLGGRLDDIGGQGVGRIEGVLVDADDGEPEWIVVRAGRFGHRTLVPARHAVGAAGRVWVPYSREAIRRTPRGDGGRGLTRDDEERLLTHYGVGGAGRAAELAAREPAAVTARPLS